MVIFRLGSCIFDVILIFLTSVLGTGHFSSSFARWELLLVLKDPQNEVLLVQSQWYTHNKEIPPLRTHQFREVHVYPKRAYR